jgi:hypothetical protein
MLAELQGCLSLCCPAGMGEDERADWLTVAMSELMRPPSVPSSYFQRACAHARRVADHPSKVVPAIFNYDPGHLLSRKSLEKELGEITAEIGNMEAARLEAPTYCTPEEARDILERFDMKSAFDVTRKPRDLKMPTPEELAEVAAQFRRQQRYDG